MNAFNIRAVYRLWITRRALFVLFLSVSIASPMRVSADTIAFAGSGASVAVKATATGQASQATAGSSKTSPERSSGAVTRVDLNTASAEQLASVLKGVGSSKAKAIVRYRTEVGPFRSIAELEEVKGIGPNIVALNKDRISVSRAKRYVLGKGLSG